ncbi:MAG: MarR family winged helix-turn-helix transcriptional regulator, partial [Hyphomicrobiales bacterium]
EGDRYLSFLISDAARLQRTVFGRRMRKLGITRPQWLVMTRLHRQPGLSQSELAELIEVEKATAGRLIDRLEANGWVERRPDPADRRINRIYMTAEGERMNRAMRPISRAMVEEELSALTPTDREQLVDLLVLLKRQLTAMAGEDAAAEPEPRLSEPV